MDPLSLFVFLAGSLGATAAANYSYNPDAERYLIRDLATVEGQWKFSELLSPAALNEVASILDLDGMGWWSAVASGEYRVFLLADITGVRHVLFRMVKVGADGWSLDQAYGPSGASAGDDQLALIRGFFDSVDAQEMGLPASSSPPAIAAPPPATAPPLALPVYEEEEVISIMPAPEEAGLPDFEGGLGSTPAAQPTSGTPAWVSGPTPSWE